MEDELTSKANNLQEDLHEADKRADNSERQVWSFEHPLFFPNLKNYS